jgi:trimeric autotransporter adhesin
MKTKIHSARRNPHSILHPPSSARRAPRFALGLALLATLNSQLSAFAQGTSFTYQGRLNDGANPANGNYDMRFYLRDALSGGSPVGSTNTLAPVAVSNGLFTVVLDYGSGIFTGPARWLEIAVRTNGSVSAHTVLSPREALTAVPYAITAGNLTGTLPATQLSGTLPSAQLSGTYSGVVAFSNAGDSFSGNGAGLTGVNAATLNGFAYCALPCYWNLTGNAGTSPGVNFVGTSDNQPLTLRVNNTIALRFTPGTTLPNVVGGLAGFRPSVIGSGVSGAVIAGGNAPSGGVSGFGGGDFHAVYDDDGTVGGGFGNKVGNGNADTTDAAFATVGGGVFNGASAYAATVGGGDGNLAGGQRSGVLSGYGNQALATFSFLGGGFQNLIQSNALNAVIGGGSNNVIQASVFNATIGGGAQNTIKLGTFGSIATTIGGGMGNTIETEDPRYATIAGGYGNMVNEVGSTIGGGYANTSTGAESTVAGGYQNTASGGDATVGGGGANTASGGSATVGGGSSNTASGEGATVGGGSLNKSTNFWSTVSGGSGNLSGGSRATVSGGGDNFSAGIYATVPGGSFNYAVGDYSFAAGRRAKANHQGSFVWADSQFADFASTTTDQVSFRCLGGVRFTSGSGAANQTVSWTPGSASWSFSSDRDLKEDFHPVNGSEVLEKVARLPISEWNYKGYSQRHIGAMAQDFHEAFPLNESTTTLNDADLHGVALAAIQGLNEKVKEKDAKISELEKRLADLERMVQSLAATK